VDASWVAAIASVASALIVAVAAIAALLQIRHIRNANEITIYLRLVERLDSPKTREVFAAIPPFAERLKTDSALRSRLEEPAPVPEFDEIEGLVRFLDNLTMLILAGRLKEELILAEYAVDIDWMWDRLAEAVQLRRRGAGDRLGAVYEHLAMRAKAYLASGEMKRFYGRLLHDPQMDELRS
jgi:flagellar motor component MotA